MTSRSKAAIIRIDSQPRLDTSKLLSLIKLQTDIASTRLEQQSVFDIVTEKTRALTGACASSLLLLDGSELVWRATSGLDTKDLGIRFQVAKSMAGACVMSGKFIYCQDATTTITGNRLLLRQYGIKSVIYTPLKHNDLTIGVLTAHSTLRTSAFTSDDVHMLSLLAGVAASAISNAQTYERVQLERDTDALTGLPNRRAGEEALDREIARAERHQRPLCVAMADIDHFKKVNDTHGHAMGDRVLRATATRIRETLRLEDVAYRYGGEEIQLLLSETSLPMGVACCERIRRAVLTNRLPLPVTVSIGVARLHRGESAASVVDRADARLYDAKRGGRNRVES